MQLKLAVIAAAVALFGPAHAEPVEIRLSDRLDGNLDSYCLDISGSKENADISKGLQAQTCYAYQGAMGIDQMFETTQFKYNQLYMPEFDVCAELSSIQAGARVGLAACDGSDAQDVMLSEEGHISRVSDASLCLTAGEDTRLGRGGTSQHQIKSLTLEVCNTEQSAYQIWKTRSGA